MSTSTPNPVPSDPASSYRAIENLIASYAELVDDGDFAGVGMRDLAARPAGRRDGGSVGVHLHGAPGKSLVRGRDSNPRLVFWLLEPGSVLGAGHRRRGCHEGADDPQEREEDSEPEQGGVSLAQRRHAEHDERGQVKDAEQYPEER